MLNENIKRLRKEKGFTQKDLAVKVGVSITFISQIENGISKPSDENLKKIADVLGVTVNELEKEKSLSPIEELLSLLIELTEKEIIKWDVTVYELDDISISTTINDVNYYLQFNPYRNAKSDSNYIYFNELQYNPENETEYNLLKKLYETIMMFHNIDGNIYKSISDLKSLLNEEEKE
ncbi:helix-turn-helix domain-containing protein [Anaerococcus prevotii]|uniref:DNA-binding helix-turn-helix protein n=1 Tax=Anaerococcus prevotii ACS-065-V-Col13 TaxID=879305 RepID=F0GU34_9FIRM|nr:helix-turn-helix transcriptional regulator [Anaerococcus prevotii]EGC82411.1 DNA-binding helix-turn-helix protein [Anaerococcus prevotii ACS-065-V-Col13]